MPPMRLGGYVRGLAPGLPRRVWALEAGVLVNAVGTGVVYPFLLIYLHNVRGVSLPVAGLALAAFGAVSFVATPSAGALVDRIGARATLVAGLLLLALGFGILAFAETAPPAFAALAVAGLGNGAFWPAQSALLVSLVPQERRAQAFSVQRMVYNLGLGAGGVVGGIVAVTGDPSTFTALFVADAASFLVYAAIVPFLHPIVAREPRRGRAGYGAVLRDRPFVALVALNVVFATVAYAQFEAMMPAFAKNDVGVGEVVIGLLFTINWVGVVVLQLPVTRALEGRSRTTAFAVAAWFWSVAFLVLLLTGSWLSGAAAALALALAVVAFTVGETLHGPTVSALAADLAPETLRGRYLALVTNSYALGFALGPALGGVLLAVSPTALWLLAALGVAAAGVAALALEGHIPPPLRHAPRTQAHEHVVGHSPLATDDGAATP